MAFFCMNDPSGISTLIRDLQSSAKLKSTYLPYTLHAHQHTHYSVLPSLASSISQREGSYREESSHILQAEAQVLSSYLGEILEMHQEEANSQGPSIQRPRSVELSMFLHLTVLCPFSTRLSLLIIVIFVVHWQEK